MSGKETYEALLNAHAAMCRSRDGAADKIVASADGAPLLPEDDGRRWGRTVRLTGLSPTSRAQDIAQALHRAVAAVLPAHELPEARPPPPGIIQGNADDMGRDRGLLLAWGCAVQQCRLLATVRDEYINNNNGDAPAAAAAAAVDMRGRGSRGPVPAPPSTSNGGSYRVEALLTFKKREFVDALMGGPRIEACDLRLPHIAIDQASVRARRVVPTAWDSQHGGDHEVAMRLCGLSLGNLVAVSALPGASAAGKMSDAASVLPPTDPAAADLRTSLFRQDTHVPHVLAHWWSSPPPAVGATASSASTSAPAPLPAPPTVRNSWEAAAADPSALYINPARRALSIVFCPALWGSAAGDGAPCGMLPFPNTPPGMPPRRPGTQPGPWVKLHIPFSLLRGPIAVRVLDGGRSSPFHPDPAMLHPTAPHHVIRYQLILSLNAPPDVYVQLSPAERQEERSKMLDLMIRGGGGSGAAEDAGALPRHREAGWEDRLGGRHTTVGLDTWPPGSVGAARQGWFARGGDFTAAHTPPDCMATVTGACLTYVLHVWQGPKSDGGPSLLEMLESSGLATPADTWAVFAPPVPIHPSGPAAQVRVLTWAAQRLVPEVGYALLCLTSSGQLPWELVTSEMVSRLAAHRPGVAEVALLNVASSGRPLSAQPAAVLERALVAVELQRTRVLGAAQPVQARGAEEDQERLAALLLGYSAPGEGADTCITRRLHVTPTRTVARPPEMNLSNRVLRDHADFRTHFARVCFSDELGAQLFLTSLPTTDDAAARASPFGQLPSGPPPSGHDALRRSGPGGKRKPPRKGAVYVSPPLGEPWARPMVRRLREVLSGGFLLLGRRYQLLAFSSSQLRTGAAWFMAPVLVRDLADPSVRARWAHLLPDGDDTTPRDGGKVVLDADMVRYALGSFDDCRCYPSKYAARLGQAFSSTVTAVQYIHIPELGAVPEAEEIDMAWGSDAEDGPRVVVLAPEVDAPDEPQAPAPQQALDGGAVALAPPPAAAAGVAPAPPPAADDEWFVPDQEVAAPQTRVLFHVRADPAGGRMVRGNLPLPNQEQGGQNGARRNRNVQVFAAGDELMIPDVVVIDEQDHDGRARYVVSDGCAPMGLGMARTIMARLGLQVDPPRAIQIRYAGFKGMLAPWGTDVVPDNAIRLRPSMKKFESTHTDVEVVQVASFIPGYINRQIISLLLSLGLDRERGGQVVFDKATLMCEQLDAMLTDPALAVGMLRRLGYVDGRTCALLTAALTAGLPPSEPYLERMLGHIRRHALSCLRTKHRIHVEASAFLLGVIDELGVLEPHEVFIRVHRPGDDEPYTVQKKWVLVTKNPCLHPGDIRVQRAVDRPALSHLVNVVVFPRNVTRPITDMITGSDLDGDLYFCCWDEQLIPLDDDDQPSVAPAASYDPLPSFRVDGVWMDPHLIDQYLYYQVSDTLGMIANAHVAMADQHPNGARCHTCVRLAELHSHAADFAKTCQPVPLPQYLRPKVYPHFMENTTKPSYRSDTVLGRIYDWAVAAEAAALASPTAGGGSAVPSPAPRLVLADAPTFELEASCARELCWLYNCDLLRLMAKYGAATEVELLTGWLLARSGEHARKKDGLRQQVLLEVGALQAKYRRLFFSLPLPGQELGGGLGAEPSTAALPPSDSPRDTPQRPTAPHLHEAAREVLVPGLLAAGGDDPLADDAAPVVVHSDDPAGERDAALLVRASAWYHAAYSPELHPSAPSGGVRLLSFGWLHMARLLRGVSEAERAAAAAMAGMAPHASGEDAGDMRPSLRTWSAAASAGGWGRMA